MLKTLRVVVFLLLMITVCFFYGINHKQNIIPNMSFISGGKILNIFSSFLLSKGFNYKTQGETNNTSSSTTTLWSPSEVLRKGDGIIFMETTDRMQPRSLVLCALESAARVYKNRPIAFFMKGLNNTNIEETVKKHFPVLSSLRNIYFFPLEFEEVFTDTPLHSWYQQIDPQQQSHWTHVSADGCRIALIWKHGGIYLDSDVISMRTIPSKVFLAASASKASSNGIFGFSAHHDFPQKCMEGFVEKYNSRVWGQQGPILFTRIINRFCYLPKFNRTEDIMCRNITFFHPQRFYPISYPAWRAYYKVWDKLPTFNDSYAVHLWNYMNSGAKLTMVPGSNTLVEHIYKQYCPSTYNAVARNETT